MARHRRALGSIFVVVLGFAGAGCGGGHSESHGGSSQESQTSTTMGSHASTSGEPHGSSGTNSPRTIDVTMKEFAYEPVSVSVKVGETVKFVFRNEGTIVHDAFLGDEAAQKDHEEEMRSGKTHEGHVAVRLEPGRTGEFTHTFDKAGEALLIGCHEVGHYAAGMKLAVTVS